MQIVSLKVRNHTIIKSWRQGRTIQFLLSALSEKNWGAKHFFQPMIKTSIKHIIYFNCIHPSLLMCCWLGSIGLWILGLGEGLGFWLDCLYCETGRDHFLIFWWSCWHFRIATITISNWDSQHCFSSIFHHLDILDILDALTEISSDTDGRCAILMLICWWYWYFWHYSQSGANAGAFRRSEDQRRQSIDYLRSLFLDKN